MASFFRAACAVYWFTWLMSLSYVIGISIYEDRYIIPTDEYVDAANVVKALCYASIALSMVGCIFVKCDISHIVWVICYGIPAFIILPAFCIYSFKKSRNIPDIDIEMLINETISYGKNSPFPPPWLQRVELNSKCCGIYTWKDYLVFNIDISGDALKYHLAHDNYKSVPYTCCRNITDKKDCLGNIPLVMYNASLDKRTNAQKRKEHHFYGNLTETPTFPYLNPSAQGMINLKGCGELLVNTAIGIENAHVTFMIVLFVCSVMMFLVYIKGWCASRRFNKGRSDHSLDVQTISVLDIPASSPMHIEGKISPHVSFQTNPEDQTKTTPSAQTTGPPKENSLNTIKSKPVSVK